MTIFAFAAAAATPLPLSADKELSVRCLVYSALLADNDEASAEDKQVGSTSMLYWLGRVNAEYPDSDVEKLVPHAALRLKSENIEKEQEYCGSETAGRSVDMERASKILGKLKQAAEAQAKSK